MNIYKVERLDDWDYDECDEMVCYAENEQSAKKLQPEVYCSKYWKEENLKVIFLGANEEIKEESIILISYRAG